MSFVSYAQNFEDAMLWRALKHVPNGFYVDVGAQDPVVDSVSKGFYEHGWRGIHIEPVPHYAELLRKDRPDETVLQIALADTDGTLELNVIAETGLSTALDVHAERHQTERGYERRRIVVPALTLNSAFRSLPHKEVHWLKIDVEGFEERVLKGWDGEIVRPWIIVVEATVPGSRETDYERWEPMLTNANYEFVYFDGLNRFYTAKEHAELKPSFSCPPNVFDEIVLSGVATSSFSRGLIASHHAREKELVAQTREAQRQLHDVLHSRSWRVTAPLRFLASRLRRFKGLYCSTSPMSELRRALRSNLRRLAHWAIRHRTLARVTREIFSTMPGVKHRLRLLVHGSSMPPTQTGEQVATEIEHLSSRAVRVYTDLKRARGAQKR